MVVCPVCENAQAGGSECEVCGRRLQAPSEAAPSIVPLDGLEPTFQAAAPAVPGELVPGLEPTGFAAVAAPPGEGVPDVEPTRTAPVDPPVAALDVDRIGDGVPVEERMPYPAVVACRYCRTEALPGAKLCERCGMRLPTAELSAPDPSAAGAVRVCSCGTPIRGPRCPACGARTG